MNDFAQLLSFISEEMKKNEEMARKPVNQTFDTEDDAFAYYRRLASLRPGDTVTYNTTHGEKRGVFLTFTERAMPVVFGWEDGKHSATAISPLCVLFADEIYDVNESELEEFPRT